MGSIRVANTDVWVGTSGYNYPEWRGTFYPKTLPAAKMLSYYSERLSTVEINYTFYRMPSVKVLEGWAAATPDAFRFTLKAPRRITHVMKLQDCEELVEVFCSRAKTLGEKLGVLLFQLPPWFRKSPEVLEDFLALLPSDVRAAFEFRHNSWHSEDVFHLLRKNNTALCIMDSERLTTPVELTASFGYFRLRDEGYTESDISQWGVIVREKALAHWGEVFVYFKHEESGIGPEFARLLTSNLLDGQNG